MVRTIAFALVFLVALRGAAAPWLEILEEDFDTAVLDPLKWATVPDRTVVPTWDDHDGGKAAHFRSESGDRGIVTVPKPEPPYRLTFDFLQPGTEAGGYRLVVHHPSRYDNLWWFEVDQTECAVWTMNLGGWAPRWTSASLKPDAWFRVEVTCEAESVQLVIRDAQGQTVATSGALPHDDLPDPGGILFTAASGGGLRGCVFDTIRLETMGRGGVYRTTVPVERALHDAVTAPYAVPPGGTLTLRTADGLILGLDRDAAAQRLEIGAVNLCGDAGATGGFYAWEISEPMRYHRFTGSPEPLHDDTLQLQCEALNLRLEARFQPTADRITVSGDLRDTTGKDRALVLVWVLPLEAAGWQWGDSLLAGRPISETGRYHNSMAYGLAGASGRHLVAPFPWASLSTAQRGLMVARPLDAPRLMSWWYDFTPAARFLAVRVELGLSPDTRKFPSHATFSLALSPLPRPEWGMRAAAQRYYDLYPESFVRRVKPGQEGLWTLWVTTEVPQPEDFALIFHEQEPYSEDRIVFDDQHNALSFTYAEPSTLWQRCTNWDEQRKLQAGPFLEQVRQRAAQPRTVTTDYPFSQPQPLPDAVLAQALLTSYLGREGDLTSVYSVATEKVGINCNSDPELPKPNRASLWFDYEGIPALNDPRVDGAYIDSVGWSAFDAAEDFRREHWATADIPLVPSFHSGGVTQLGGFSHYELYEAIANAMHERGKLVLANTFPFAHGFVAHLIDVLGAGEGGDVEAFHDPARLSYCRALAYHKPLSHMNYAYFHPDTAPEARERGLQRNLVYAVWPGSGNVFAASRIEPWRPLYRRYMPLFAALALAGWEPITEARTTPETILIERYGRPGGERAVYLVLHNPSPEPVAATARLTGALAATSWDPATRDEVSGEALLLTREGLSLTLKPWQTVMLKLQPSGRPTPAVVAP